MAAMQGDGALVDEIRAAAAWVASRATRVRIDRAAIPLYAASLPAAGEQAGAAAGDPAQGDPAGGAAANAGTADGAAGGTAGESAHVTGGPPELRAAFFLTLDAINFGSGWFPTLRKREGRSGYYTIATGLRDRFHAEGAWSARELRGLEADELAVVFDQDPDHELMALFARSLNDLGRRIEERYDGDFLGPVRAAADAEELIEELAGWDCFADTSRYGGRPIPIFKRAQIAAADLQGAGVADFDDLDRLTLFADNLGPHVLRLDGVLRFDPGLVDRIESGQLLAHGSPEEIEMRCAAIHAAELIAAERPDLAPFQIDRLLWHRGGGPAYKAIPRPRCRCTAY